MFNNRHGDSLEIIERDGTSRKVGSWKFQVCNIKLANNIIGFLINKYGFNPKLKMEEDSQEKDFLKQDMNL